METYPFFTHQEALDFAADREAEGFEVSVERHNIWHVTLTERTEKDEADHTA